MQLPIEEYQHCLRTVAARFRTITPKPVFQNGLMVPADKIRWALAPLKELENREALLAAGGPPGPVGPQTAPMVRARTQAARDTIAARRAEGKKGVGYGALKYPGEPGPLPAIELEPTGDEDDNFGKVRVSVPAPVLDYDGEEMPAIPVSEITAAGRDVDVQAELRNQTMTDTNRKTAEEIPAKARKHPIAPLDIDNAVGSVGVQKTEKL